MSVGSEGEEATGAPKGWAGSGAQSLPGRGSECRSRLVCGNREGWGPCTVEGRGPVHSRHNLGVGAIGHMGPELPGSSGLSMEARNLDFYVKSDFSKLATNSNSFEALCSAKQNMSAGWLLPRLPAGQLW